MSSIAEEIDFLIQERAVVGNRKELFPLIKRIAILFFLIFAYGICFICRLLSRQKKKPKLIVHSLTEMQVCPRGSASDFLEFIQADRFGFNCNSEDILIEIQKIDFFRKLEVRNTPNIEFYLLTRCSNSMEFLQFGKIFVLATLAMLRSAKLAVISIKDLFQILFGYSCWSAVKSSALFITTQSCMTKLPIAFYLAPNRLERHMMWYSTNNRYFQKVDELFRSIPNAKDLNSFVDLHWVWNEEEARWFHSNGITKTKVVGSIIFVPTLQSIPEIKSFDVVYFDVTAIPRNDIFLSEKMLCMNLKKLSDVMERINLNTKDTIGLYLKPKRQDDKIHSVLYLSLRESLAKRDKVHILDYRLNLYDLISRAKVVISVPFTSPANIALELGVPTAYFCADVRDYQLDQEQNGISILTSEIDLEIFIKKSLGS